MTNPHLTSPTLYPHTRTGAMFSSFITETSKDIATDAGTFRITCRVNLLEGEVRYTAYEPLASLGAHHSFKRDDGGWWGNVAERMLTDELDQRFEGRPGRRVVVEEFYKANREQARSLIMKAFPEAAQGVDVMGAVVLPLDQLPESVRTQMTLEPVYVNRTG